MLFVAAAGNSGVDVDVSSLVDYPAAFDLPNLISVAAINRNGALAYFSSYGAERVHIAAPGHDIYSTYPNDSGYESVSGTSMAAPHVSGLAALLFSIKPELEASDVKNIIISANEPLANLDKTIFSAGIADAKRALDLAADYDTSDYKHQVIFRSWDNSVLKKESVKYGSNATAPADPARVNFDFAGWDTNYKNITGNRTITALYEQNRLIATGSATFSYDAADRYLLGFAAGSTVENLLAGFSNPADQIRVVSSDGVRVADMKAILSTGMRLQLYNNDLKDQKELIIRGDVNGDGQISALDLLKVKQHLLGRSKLNLAYYEAGKINAQEQMSALDLLQLKKHLLGQREIR